MGTGDIPEPSFPAGKLQRDEQRACTSQPCRASLGDSVLMLLSRADGSNAGGPAVTAFDLRGTQHRFLDVLFQGDQLVVEA